MSYVYPKEFIKFMEWLEGICGELRITRGKLHEYIGMALDFWTLGEIWVTIIDYL